MSPRPALENCKRLNEHYSASADIQVHQFAPACYWARAAEIQAAAVRLRESIYVIDVKSNGLIQMKSYSSKARHATDGSVHEFGFDVSMNMDDLDALMKACAVNRVIPIVLALRSGR